VNHLEGHLAAVFLEPRDGGAAPPAFPHLGVLVSGGHSELLIVRDHGRYDALGATRDDAAGEAFDKVGKVLGMAYPAGAQIDGLAATGNSAAIAFPRAMRGRGYDLSFSGLKTAVAQHVREHGVPTGAALADLCASFQAALVEQIAEKVGPALEEHALGEVVLAGGVAANRGLRAGLLAVCARHGARLHVPPPSRCTDNAAMIACAGTFRLQRGERAGLDLNAVASLPLDERTTAKKGPGAGRARA
jgi:N6-L-threonylcarbamoyladenine synthase